MNEIQNFNFEGNEIHTVVIDDLPYFVGKDVADVLGYANNRDALAKHVDFEDKNTVAIPDGTSGNPNKTVINESGLYALILGSKLPTAKKFKHWVTSVVLPSIRQDGAYVAPDTAADWLNNPDMMIDILIRYKDAQAENQRLHDENVGMQPKALFADAVSASHSTILVGELAKLLRQNGVHIGQNRLFEWLRVNGYLVSRKATDWNMPTQKAMDLELFTVKETAITHSDGHTTISKTTKVTGKGQQYFINKLINPDSPREIASRVQAELKTYLCDGKKAQQVD